MSDPIQNALRSGPPALRGADRPRPYVPPPTAPATPPDYARFCEVHTRHRALWRLTYAVGHAAPYRAHHRDCDGIALAATDLEALDFALETFAAPQRTRSYLDALDGPDHRDHRRRADAHHDRRRTLDSRDARCLHQMADDLAASTHEHTYWTSAVRDAALEILSRIADLLGDTCALRSPDADPSTHLPCLRPTDHDGDHLDASGRTWHNTEEDAR